MSCRVHELALKYEVKMRRSHWHGSGKKASVLRLLELPRRLAMRMQPEALAVQLTKEDVAYLEEPYIPHRIVGAIDHNPAEGVMLLDEKK